MIGGNIIEFIIRAKDEVAKGAKKAEMSLKDFKVRAGLIMASFGAGWALGSELNSLVADIDKAINPALDKGRTAADFIGGWLAGGVMKINTAVKDAIAAMRNLNATNFDKLVESTKSAVEAIDKLTDRGKGRNSALTEQALAVKDSEIAAAIDPTPAEEARLNRERADIATGGKLGDIGIERTGIEAQIAKQKAAADALRKEMDDARKAAFAPKTLPETGALAGATLKDDQANRRHAALARVQDLATRNPEQIAEYEQKITELNDKLQELDIKRTTAEIEMGNNAANEVKERTEGEKKAAEKLAEERKRLDKEVADEREQLAKDTLASELEKAKTDAEKSKSLSERLKDEHLNPEKRIERERTKDDEKRYAARLISRAEKIREKYGIENEDFAAGSNKRMTPSEKRVLEEAKANEDAKADAKRLKEVEAKAKEADKSRQEKMVNHLAAIETKLKEALALK